MTHYLDAAIEAARAAGDLLRHNFQQPLRVNSARSARHQARDRCADAGTDHRSAPEKFPEHALYGEEGIVGDQTSDHQWVVDPLDGTVNYFYGIPHFCVSIALRCQGEIIVGVIYDPMRDEMWTAQKGETADIERTREFRVSERADLAEAVISVGLSKTGVTIDAGLAVAAGNGASRAQMPVDGQRRARHGLRGLRTLRCLHRTRHQPVGYRGRLDSRGNGRRHSRHETAHRHERQIQHCCF